MSRVDGGFADLSFNRVAFSVQFKSVENARPMIARMKTPMTEDFDISRWSHFHCVRKQEILP